MRWTKELAAAEFGINPRTLSTRLRQLAITAGRDGKFPTSQICQAVFGDIDSEKLRLTKAQADKIELENKQSLRLLIPLGEAEEFLNKFFAAARERILSNLKLDEREKDKILDELRGSLDLAANVASPDSHDLRPAAAA